MIDRIAEFEARTRGVRPFPTRTPARRRTSHLQLADPDPDPARDSDPAPADADGTEEN